MRAGVLAFLIAAGPAEACRLALALGFDVSASVDAADYAIQRDLSGPYVLTVDGDGMVSRTGVKLGSRIENDQRIITEGLTAEQTVVVQGLQRARPGAKVNAEMAKVEE